MSNSSKKSHFSPLPDVYILPKVGTRKILIKQHDKNLIFPNWGKTEKHKKWVKKVGGGGSCSKKAYAKK
ncbi:hypothetical protein FLY67_001700 [Escherichia coli]|nr:hypothetical protein [Escherichia coli]EHR9071224.1 hypothetical protein [Escherichia coli]EIG4428853.1 hypothetical protein [Escherichia coli]EIR9219236.1 hypothetical protein [Escherichia coli]ELV8234195.1 hypothetical protein [Escherichia coli]